MGTRSIVATRTGETSWKGRYIHWDGYPEGVGAAIVALINRDGREQVVKTLITDHYGWSNLDLTVTADTPLGLGHDDGRFVNVPGYGLAYTTEQGQSSPDDWHTEADPEDSWCEFAYVIEDDSTVTAYSNTGSAWELITSAWTWGDDTTEESA